MVIKLTVYKAQKTWYINYTRWSILYYFGHTFTSFYVIFFNLRFIPVTRWRSCIVKSVTQITLGKLLRKPLDAPDPIASPCMTLSSVCVSAWGGFRVCQHASGYRCLSNFNMNFHHIIQFMSRIHYWAKLFFFIGLLLTSARAQQS